MNKEIVYINYGFVVWFVYFCYTHELKEYIMQCGLTIIGESDRVSTNDTFALMQSCFELYWSVFYAKYGFMAESMSILVPPIIKDKPISK